MEENVILTWFIVFFECADASQIRPTVTNVKPSPVPQTFVWLNFILTMRIEWYKGILSTLNLKINFPHEISYRRPSLYFSRLSFQPKPIFFFFLNQVDFSLHVRLKNKSDLISHFTANWNFNSFNSLTFNVIQMFLLLFSISFWLLCCSELNIRESQWVIWFKMGFSCDTVHLEHKWNKTISTQFAFSPAFISSS